jgi:DNA-binding HxlR family transcriptional regulator
MRQTSFAEMQCSLARTLEVVGDWWSPLVLRDLYLGVDRFDDLVSDLGISRNLLTSRLDKLVTGGVVRRERYQERPPRDRYLLTGAGRELVPILLTLMSWGDRWATPDGGPPLGVRHRTCGHVCTPRVTCSECGEPLRAEDLAPVPGPGGRPGPGTMLIAQRLSAGPGAAHRPRR